GWQPDHLSAYGLTLDPGSLWGAAGVAGLPSEETVVAQYWRLARTAAERGFEHYEISNYARPGFRSRHNQIYWRAAEYLAAGPGACGFVGRVRYANVRATPRYADTLEEGRLPLDTFEELTPRQRLAERLILGLRTADGVPAAWLDARLLCSGGREPGSNRGWPARGAGWLRDAAPLRRTADAGRGDGPLSAAGVRGRVPTDKAYRFYVNSFPPAQAAEAPPAPGTLPTRRSGIDGFMERTSAHLSVATKLTGLLLAPPLQNTTLARVELIPLEEGDRA